MQAHSCRVGVREDLRETLLDESGKDATRAIHMNPNGSGETTDAGRFANAKRIASSRLMREHPPYIEAGRQRRL